MVREMLIFESLKMVNFPFFVCVSCPQKKRDKNKVIVLNLSKDVNLLYFFISVP